MTDVSLVGQIACILIVGLPLAILLNGFAIWLVRSARRDLND